MADLTQRLPEPTREVFRDWLGPRPPGVVFWPESIPEGLGRAIADHPPPDRAQDAEMDPVTDSEWVLEWTRREGAKR